MPTRGYRKGISDRKVPLPKSVRTRLSENDLALLSGEAARREVTVARLIRQVVVAHIKNQRTELPHPRGPTNELLRQFARIGNNLNQLTRQANAGMVTVPAGELRSCLAEINRLARDL